MGDLSRCGRILSPPMRAEIANETPRRTTGASRRGQDRRSSTRTQETDTEIDRMRSSEPRFEPYDVRAWQDSGGPTQTTETACVRQGSVHVGAGRQGDEEVLYANGHGPQSLPVIVNVSGPSIGGFFELALLETVRSYSPHHASSGMMKVAERYDLRMLQGMKSSATAVKLGFPSVCGRSDIVASGSSPSPEMRSANVSP